MIVVPCAGIAVKAQEGAMVDLKTLTSDHLSKEGWQKFLGSLGPVNKARTDPRFFRQVDRFARFMREVVSIAVELNSNFDAAETAFDYVKATKISARNKTINRFEDIQQQTYKICMESLQRDFDNMYSAFQARNLEALENQYRQINSWPIRYKVPA